MEAPSSLNGYFNLVDDFFNKTFRDNSSLFVAIKTKQQSKMVRAQGIDDADDAEAAAPNAGQDVPVTGALPSQVSFSPRMFLNRDGTALGKVKISCGTDFHNGCRLEQGLALNTQGTVTGFGKVKDVVDGLVVGGRMSVNTISPASQDVTAVNLRYTRPDLYTHLGYQRNGLGSSNLLVDCGALFVNLVLGGGFERQQISYLEQSNETQGQTDVMYAGLGFTGVNWSLAAKISRTDAWSMARVAAIQQLTPSSAVACMYNMDIREARAESSIGFTQGLRLRLPSLIVPKHRLGADHAGPASASAASLSTPYPFVLACKASSNGWCSATIRGVFSDILRWGLVVHKNLQTKEAVQFGLVLSLESDS